MTVPILQKKDQIPGQMSIDDVDEDTRKLLEAQAAATDTGPALRPVMTAFIVIVNQDGSHMAAGDLEIINSISLDRIATADDVYGSCAVVMRDIMTTETAARTQHAMAQMGAAMQQQAQAQQLQASLGDIRGGRRG